MNSLTHSLLGFPKYVLGFISTLFFRLLSPYLGMWNMSPLMATELTGSKAYGPVVAGAYGFFSMILLDIIVGRVGSWTIVTSITYGLIGVWGAYFLKNRSATSINFIKASIIGTLLFDIITGILMGPIMYSQPWSAAIIGQIPFTLRHLTSNIVFAGILSPWFYKKVMNNNKFEIHRLFRLA